MISVIIPLYNKQSVIARTVESVINQTYTDWELLIIDDGSTDDSAEIVQKYCDDNKIKYIWKPNGGVSSARNLGIKMAHGEWVCYLDADDYFLPEALAILSELGKKYTKTNIVGANYYFEHNGIRRISSWCKKESVVKNVLRSCVFMAIDIRAGAMMVKTELMRQNYFDERISKFEDAKSNFDLFRNNAIAFSPKPIMIYSLDNLGLSQVRGKLSKDFISYLDFHNKPFWEKIWLGWLLRLGIYLYPQDKVCLKKQYSSYILWMYLSRGLFLLGKLVNQLMRKV